VRKRFEHLDVAGPSRVVSYEVQPTQNEPATAATESFAGKPVDDNLDLMQGILDTTLPAWLNALEAAAETRAS
jgi:hypothetical protein